MQIIKSDLNALCRGASFLGSGGGGDTDELIGLVQEALNAYGPVRLITVDELANDGYVAAIELVGATMPESVRPRLDQFFVTPVLDYARAKLGLNITAVMPVEIGGSNALTPLCVAGRAGLPIVDGDLLGRAFPEISLISTNLYDIRPSIAIIGDPLTGEVDIIEASTYEILEEKARGICAKNIAMTAVLIPIILSKKQARRCVIRNTVSHAIAIGKQSNTEQLLSFTKGRLLCEGKVTSWQFCVDNGFLFGKLTITTDDQKDYVIDVKNEYLLATLPDGTTVAAPDIISLLDKNKLAVRLSDQIALGDEVLCLVCSGPAQWYSERARDLIAKGCRLGN